MELLTKVKAFGRLHNIKEKKNELECAKNTILKHIKSRFPDPLDQVKVLDMVGMDLQDSLYRDLKKNSKAYLETEKAHDRIRMVNLKMA